MFRTTLRKAISLTALFLFSAAVPAAANPPGWERWVAPHAKYNVDGAASAGFPVPHFFYTMYPEDWGKVGIGTPGYRPVDVEINWHEPVNWQKVQPKDILHWISVVEVADEGPLEDAFTQLDLEETTDTIQNVLDNDIAARPIDIELYFREETDIDGTVSRARYATIWVQNKGENYSDWEFIPPTPYDMFMALLDDKYDDLWRPYDIEFAVGPAGRLWGSALLAPAYHFFPIEDGEFEEYLEVDTMWTYFFPSELESLYDDGWQLLDVEVPIQLENQGPLVTEEFFNEDIRFGIFVRVPWLFDPTDTFLEYDKPGYNLNKYNGILLQPARPIDIEPSEYQEPSDIKLAEPGYYLYTEAWLKGQ